ncbi:MAG: type II methionyl aminopeptidase [Candidatus Bathyarchaeota archaeon]|nr:type II methionyl aminopeptidase [Candidatus Bathyarchaeota archaeon]
MESTDEYIRAGKIAANVRETIKAEVKPGVKIIDICDRVESMIRQQGAAPAFPCNVDVDKIAAHYASPIGDQSIIQNGQLVKVDIGVHVDGFIADTAVTICLDPTLLPLVKAAEDALEVACRAAKPGVRASEIGATIEHIIKNRGMKPIRNLTGHKLDRYIVHAGRSIPNIGGFNLQKLEKGEVYAIEPFTVLPNAAGEVRDGPPSNIYHFNKKRNVTNSTAKDMLKVIQEEYRTLPFASRWLLTRFPGIEGQRGFQELLKNLCIEGYPQLIEKTGGIVAQAEHTIIVTNEGGLVTTK